MADVEGIDASAISAVLLAKHKPPEWATFSELRDSTGFGQSRTIDVATFNMWKSGRYARIAYEIKVSRNDFLRELDQPEKHAWVEDHFHETYFAAPAGLIKPEEVPAHWGLLEVFRRAKTGVLTTRRKVRAKRRAPKDPGIGLTMSILRRAAEQVSRERRRVYRFEGQEVTPEDMTALVMKRVEDGMQPKRVALEELQNKARKQYVEAEDAKRALRAPLDQLRRAARRYGFTTGEPTPKDVDQMIEAAVQHALRDKLSAIRQAYAALEPLQGIGEDG